MASRRKRGRPPLSPTERTKRNKKGEHIRNTTSVDLGQELFQRWATIKAENRLKNHRDVAQLLFDRFTDKSKPVRSCIGFHGWKDVCQSEKLVKEITGVSISTFKLLLEQLPKPLPVSGGLTTENGLLVFLMKLRMDIPYEHLAAQFSVAPSTVEQVFMFILLTLAKLTSSFIQLPNKLVVKNMLPSFLQRNVLHCQLVVDCLEIETEAPSQLLNQLLLMSGPNNTFRAKALVGLTPNGYVCFVSNTFCGSISQAKLSRTSGLFSSPDFGDEVLLLQPDKYVSSLQEITVHTMPNWPERGQQSLNFKQDVVLVNSHVDMLKQRLRQFGILRSKVTLGLLPYLDSLVHVCAMLANFEEISADT